MHRLRDQALPHEAPESNPSQKTKQGRKEIEREKTEPESATHNRQTETSIRQKGGKQSKRATVLKEING